MSLIFPYEFGSYLGLRCSRYRICKTRGGEMKRISGHDDLRGQARRQNINNINGGPSNSRPPTLAQPGQPAPGAGHQAPPHQPGTDGGPSQWGRRPERKNSQGAPRNDSPPAPPTYWNKKDQKMT